MLTSLDLTLIALFACVAWWTSTGLILSLVSRSEASYRWSMLAGLLAAGIALGAIVSTRHAQTIEATLVGFAASIVVWGAIEMALLMGFVVGPNREPLPRGLAGWQRFKGSWSALAHHELALFGTMALLLLVALDAANQIAFHCFALLWVMRLSTKLNIFLGVSNAGEDFLGPRLAHLRSHFAKAPMNLLFPVSITAVTVTVVLLTSAAIDREAAPHTAAAAALLATFSFLALVEHWLLVLPVPTSTLWPWARRHQDDAPVRPQPMTPRMRAEP